MKNTLVEVKNLRLQRGTFSLHVPSWALQPGEVVGLVGPNGAGKTTLLEAIAGLRPAQAEHLQVLGHEPWQHPSIVRLSLGFMWDDMPIFAMKIGQLLRLVSGYYPSWDKTLVEELLERFQLDPNQPSDELSKGQGTRLRLLLALAFQPKVLLLDEPAAGLDLAGKRALLEIVMDVVRGSERSVVISSHMLSDVERLADRLLVLNQGEVLQNGKTDELVGEERTLEEALLVWGAAG